MPRYHECTVYRASMGPMTPEISRHSATFATLARYSSFLGSERIDGPTQPAATRFTIYTYIRPVVTHYLAWWDFIIISQDPKVVKLCTNLQEQLKVKGHLAHTNIPVEYNGKNVFIYMLHYCPV